jgi:predicted amidophosphoribosyltransferase
MDKEKDLYPNQCIGCRRALKETEGFVCKDCAKEKEK